MHLADQASHCSALTVNRILRFFSFFCAITCPARTLRRFLIEFPKSRCGGLPSGLATLWFGPLVQAAEGHWCGAGGRRAPQWACTGCTGAEIGGSPASQAVGCQNPFSKFSHTKSGPCRPLGAPHPGAAGFEPKTTPRVYEKGRPKGSPGERSGASQ